jgi:hypothetical protein
MKIAATTHTASDIEIALIDNTAGDYSKPPEPSSP